MANYKDVPLESVKLWEVADPPELVITTAPHKQSYHVDINASSTSTLDMLQMLKKQIMNSGYVTVDSVGYQKSAHTSFTPSPSLLWKPPPTVPGPEPLPGDFDPFGDLVVEPAAEVKKPKAAKKPKEDKPEPEPVQKGLLSYDQNGYAYPVATVENNVDMFGNDDLIAKIREVANKIGHGRIVGRGRTTMAHSALVGWLHAWHNGNLKRCYEIEATVAQPHSAHPGAPANTDTHKVIWRPSIDGEVPAGVDIPGKWSSPEAQCLTEEVSNYLIAAKMAYPQYLASSARRRWINGHKRGDKIATDAISRNAKFRADCHYSHSSSTPCHTELSDEFYPTYQKSIEAASPPKMWTLQAVAAYLKDHELADPLWWEERVAAIDAHREKVLIEEAIEAAKIKLSYVPDQPTLSGYHTKAVLEDQHGRRWLFKPCAEGKHRFRAETEHEAHVLARLWGYRTAESRLVEFDGHFGQIQAMLPVAGSLLGVEGAGFAELTTEQLCTIAKEHLLDWAIDNDDTHGDNIVILDDGAVVGIDKGRAWRYFGGWAGLSADASANSNAQLVYTSLYEAIAKGHLPRETVDAMYTAVARQARRMQRLNDSTLAEIIGRAVANRPHYRPSFYQQPVKHAPTNAEELIAAATARKNTLAADMDTVWGRVYAAAGWEMPEPDLTALGDNAQGHPLYSGLLDPDLHDAVACTKSYGTATFVAGTDIEDGHILLWRERIRHTGEYLVRGQFKVRGSNAYSAMSNWCKSRYSKPAKPSSSLPMETYLYECIIAGAKTISYHCADSEYNEEKLGNLGTAEAELKSLLKKAETEVMCQEDPFGKLGATVDMCTTYLGYIETIKKHKEEHTKSKAGDFPRFVYTPTTPPPAPEQPVNVMLTAASRLAAHLNNTPKFGDDGELEIGADVLVSQDYGQNGTMYEVALPTGEVIEFRCAYTGAPLSMDGITTFTVPGENIAESLPRIVNAYAEMGLTITPAVSEDLELFYWRHLAGVLRDRADTRPGGHSRYSSYQDVKYTKFWALVDESTKPVEDEIAMWRKAFAALTDDESINNFITSGGHLPRFGHFDLRQPDMPCGKPYWERFDVTKQQWGKAQMPSVCYRTGPWGPVWSGGSYSTEARIRTLAIWKSGMSSAEDMNAGSAAFVFTRANQEQGGNYPNVFFSPRVLARTSTYGFDDDKYGKIVLRRNYSYFDWNDFSSNAEGNNEMLIKDGMSLLDDIEILVFGNNPERAKGISVLANLGISEIRGIPVEERFVVRGGGQLTKAIARVRATYAEVCPSSSSTSTPSSDPSEPGEPAAAIPETLPDGTPTIAVWPWLGHGSDLVKMET